jgi:hypothetical protein
MIGAALVVALVLAFLFPSRWKVIGLALAVAAALFAAVRMVGGSATGLDILFAALWAALGAFPGAALGRWLGERTRAS